MENAASATPVMDEFTPAQWQELDSTIASYRDKSGSMIRVLNRAQEIFGFLPRDVQMKVAQGLGKPLSEVYGITTFYSFFTLIPKGKHTICSCQGTACYVRGGKQVLQDLEHMIGTTVGGTTEDREFSLESVRCMGACALAPVIRIDEDVYRQVTPKKIRSLLVKYSDKYGGDA